MSAADSMLAALVAAIPPRGVRYELTAGTGGAWDFHIFDWLYEVSGGGARRLTEYPSSFPGTIDAAAMMGAIGTILNNAHRYGGPWAHGEIVLRDPFGRVVDSMPAKAGAR